MPIPSEFPIPLESRFLEPPLLEQEASYLAASARTASFFWSAGTEGVDVSIALFIYTLFTYNEILSIALIFYVFIKQINLNRFARSRVACLASCL